MKNKKFYGMQKILKKEFNATILEYFILKKSSM